MLRRIKLAGLVGALAVVALATAGAASASTFPGSGSHAMTPQAPFWSFSDSNGSGSVQIAYSSSPYNIQLGYKLSAKNITLCDSRQQLNESITLVDLTTGKTVGHDSHVDEACDYQAHPHYVVGTTHAYAMKITEIFPVVVNGASGTATLHAQANFTITLV